MGLLSWLKRKFGGAKSATADLVPFFDFESKTAIQIPRSELSSNAIQVRIQGMEGVFWALPDQLRPGPIKHDPFSEEVREILRHIQTAFAEHNDLSLDEWEDGFRRDANAEREIAMWSRAADVYLHFASDEPSTDRRHDIYRCIVTCLTTGADSVWDVFRPKVLGRDESQKIINRFYRSSP